MTTPSPTTENSLTRDLFLLARYYLGGRGGLLILAILALVGGLTLNWSWLVAIGVAPILLAIAPCAVMCALGLCMNRAGGQSCSTETTAQKTVEPADDQVMPIPSEPVASSAAIRQSQTEEERRNTHA